MGAAGSIERHPSSKDGPHHHNHNGPFKPADIHQKIERKAHCKNHRRHGWASGLLNNDLVGKLASWGAEPGIVLANKSAHRVSYWVAQEDKKNTSIARHQQRQVVASINLHLNVGGDRMTGAAECLSRDTTKTTSTEPSLTPSSSSSSPISSSPPSSVDFDEKGVNFLTRDHRLGPMGNTQTTEIAFPADCAEMRVYAFFELDGRWRLYTNEVYSIQLFRKVFTITSEDDKVAPYIA